MHENSSKQTASIFAQAEEIAAQRHIPSATYRLQFRPDFTFRDAQALVPYLHNLGTGDCYASPLLNPRSGSSHGYDICDHSQFNPALGGAEDFEAFSTELRKRNMGLILDVVPNHMGIGDAGNAWWMDVLENGPSSVYATYFDIDWHPVKIELHDKVLLPMLEDQYGRVLENGKFRLAHENGAFFIYYCDVKLPVAPRTYSSILKHQLGTLVQALGEENEHVRELQSILTALSYLPERTESEPEKVAERNREKEIIKGRIAALYRACAYVRAAIDMAVQTFNGTVGDARSFDLLDRLIDEQAYRPAFWRVAAEEINYRRFFDINELAAIHMELPEVFEASHRLILRLLTEGKATGMRIDHPDGLWNPQRYFQLLQESYLLHKLEHRLGSDYSRDELNEAASAWLLRRTGLDGASAPWWPLYVVAEKILSPGENLPDAWPVSGTTGYDFLNAVNGLFVDIRRGKAFDGIYGRFVGEDVSFSGLTNSKKKMIMLVSMVSEINALGHQLERIAEKNRLYRDFTLNSLTFAIREVIAALPVYRTYITGPDNVGQQDQSYIEAAVAEAKKRNPRTAGAIFDFIRDSLLLRNLESFSEIDQKALVDLVMKFQQITGPVTAKGVEDTTFYTYNRLVSLNEVGGHPERFGVSVAEFHRQNAERQRHWPHAMLATSTHDTKRSEDVRARIDVLSEIPDEWKSALIRWSRMNHPKKVMVEGENAPDRNDEYLLYQTLLGTWPDGPLPPEEFASFRERIAAYMHKATKEAKVHTSWVNPNEQYDRAVQDFVQRLLPDKSDDPFIDDLLALQRRVAYYGRYNALSQTLLKLASPGVPDIYQGTELWDYSLVDPDNRRPVDYPRRQSLLADLQRSLHRDRDGRLRLKLARELVNTIEDGRIKLYLIYIALNYRREHHDLLSEGRYIPLSVRGEARDHVCSFARALGEKAVLVVAPRLVVGLTAGIEQPPLGQKVWKGTRLALPHDQIGWRYRNLFTGEHLSVDDLDKVAGAPGLPMASVCSHFPLALLERIA
ncbi:MAG: malto-oligosyltrehalose synthase [Chloroflexi bacterium]|nr:malto-oligosyltrehalose synthase [Chloroflexota bacterium]